MALLAFLTLSKCQKKTLGGGLILTHLFSPSSLPANQCPKDRGRREQEKVVTVCDIVAYLLLTKGNLRVHSQEMPLCGNYGKRITEKTDPTETSNQSLPQPNLSRVSL